MLGFGPVSSRPFCALFRDEEETEAIITWVCCEDTSVEVCVEPDTTIDVPPAQPATDITWSICMGGLHVLDIADIVGTFRVKNWTTGVKDIVDPDIVSLAVQSPAQRIAAQAAAAAAGVTSAVGIAEYVARAAYWTVYVYGDDDNVTRLSEGKYLGKVECTEFGRWHFAWESPGPEAQGAEPGYFDVGATRA